jgi:hypothetical protein
MNQIGKCKSCGKPIINRGEGWKHADSKMAHCSSHIRSTCAEPARESRVQG